MKNVTETMTVLNDIYVIRPFLRRSERYPEPNFMGTGRALVGMLKPKQTIEQFKNNWLKQRKKQ